MIKRIRAILLHRGHHNRDSINLRWWFVFYILYMILLAFMVLSGDSYNFWGWNVSLPAMGNFSAVLWLPGLYLFYMSLCCTFFPAPTAWLVLLMASPVVNMNFTQTGNIYTDATMRITIVAAIGSLGTAIANLNEYHIFVYLLRFGYAHKLKATRLYTKALKWFKNSPFALVTLFSFLPVPVDVVRWLAISHYYNRFYYGLASFVGRFFRYALLAAAATCLKLGTTAIILIQVSFVAVIIVRWLMTHSSRPKKPVL